MAIRKLTTILIVDDVDACLPLWNGLGFKVTTSVPHGTTTGFAILEAKDQELMLQSRASLSEDLPAIAQENPASLLYADCTSLAKATDRLKGCRVLVSKRKTFYGATETWVQIATGQIIGFAEH